jgi:vacuole morphology and inheritance protein 14
VKTHADLDSAELEMTVNMLIQIDKLVQLLESPVFTCEPSL